MPGKNRLIQLEGVDDGHNVVSEPIRGVVCRYGFRNTRCSETTRSYSNDVIVGRELEREDVEDVSCIAKAGKEDERTSVATPIENLQLDVVVDTDETNPMWSGIDLCLNGYSGKKVDNDDPWFVRVHFLPH